MHPYRRALRFGDQVVKSLGMIELALETPIGTQPIPILMDVVPANVPALLGLDILDTYTLMAHHATNRMWHCMITNESPLEVEDL